MKKALKHSFLRRVLLILLIFALPLSGCVGTPKAKFEKGFGYPDFNFNGMAVAITSDTDTFEKNNVTLTVWLGTHETEDEPVDRTSFASYEYEEYPLHFVLYVCEEIYAFSNSTKNVNDYTNVENHYFIREIPEEKAFSSEYGLSESYLYGLKYKHKETVTIPEELFAEESGSIAIALRIYQQRPETLQFYGFHGALIEFDYVINPDGTVKITF